MKGRQVTLILAAGLAFACSLGTEPAECDGVEQLLPKHSDVLLRGRSASLTAEAYGGSDFTGTSFQPRQDVAVRWVSADPQVVRVAGGVASAMTVGTARLSAAACGTTVNVTVTVVGQGYRTTFIAPVPAQGVMVALNDAGDVIGRTTATGVPQNYLWRAGTFIDLGGCIPSDINNLGQVVCVGAGPLIWESGATTQWDDVPSAFPLLINDDGHVLIGTRLWRAPGDVVDLHFGQAFALSNADHVGGADSFLYPRPLLWDNGVLRTMPGSGGRYGFTRAVNDQADVGVAAECAPLSGFTVAVRALAAAGWVGHTARPGSPVCNDVASAPVALNNAGAMVGNGSQGPFLWIGSSLTLLEDVLIDPNWRLASAHGINASGQILAVGQNSSTGESGLVLLTPE